MTDIASIGLGNMGGPMAATPTLMSGGSPAAFARAEPILSRMGRKVVHCGDAGAGQAAKICNNMILGISMLAISEAFVLADALGLSRQALFDVASTSSGSFWALLNHCPAGVATPAGAEEAGMFGLLQAAGRGGDDYAAVITLLQGKAGRGP